MNGRYLIIALGIIAISWGGNLWFYQSNQLEEPIFLKHYYGGGGVFNLYYVANRDDSSRVVSVELSDGTKLHPDGAYDQFPAGDPAYASNVQSRSNHHLLKMVRFHEQQLQVRGVNHEGEAIIHFNDGKTFTADIGKVKGGLERKKDSLFHFQSSSGSSNGRSAKTVSVKEDVTIQSITPAFPEAQQAFEMKWYSPSLQRPGNHQEGKSVIKDESDEKVAGSLEQIPFPFSMERGERLRVVTHEKPDVLYSYSYPMIVKGETGNGQPFTHYILVANHPQFTPEQMDLLIERRGD